MYFGYIQGCIGNYKNIENSIGKIPLSIGLIWAMRYSAPQVYYMSDMDYVKLRFIDCHYQQN